MRILLWIGAVSGLLANALGDNSTTAAASSTDPTTVAKPANGDATPDPSAAGRARVKISEIIHDRYHIRTSLFYRDGHREILCAVYSCNGTKDILLLKNGDTVDIKECHNESFDWEYFNGATFEASNELVDLGALIQCGYNGELVDLKTPIAALCADDSNECRNAQCPSDKFCVVSYDPASNTIKTDTCGVIPDGDDYCPSIFDHKVCPADTDNLCKAIQKGAYKQAFMYARNACPTDPIQLLVDGSPVMLEDTVQYVPKKTTISVKCPPGSTYYDTFLSPVILRVTRYTWMHSLKCIDETFIPLDIELANDTVPGIYRLSISIFKNDNLDYSEGSLSIYLVNMRARVHVTATQSTDNENAIGAAGPVDSLVTLKCQIDDGGIENFGADAFSAEYRWTPPGSNEELGEGPELSIGLDRGKYSCQATLRYRTCSPHRRFDTVMSVLFDASQIPRTTTPPKPVLQIRETIHDRFGETVDVYFGDGHTRIECTAPHCTGSGPNDVIILRRGTQEVDRKACSENQTTVAFIISNVNLTLSVAHGCAYGTEWAELPIRNVRLCANKIGECESNITCDDDKFCIVTFDKATAKNQVNQCSYMLSAAGSCHPDVMNESLHYYCPPGTNSFCRCLQSNAYRSIYSLNELPHRCFNDSEMLFYNQKARYYHEMFQVHSNDTEINIQCPQGGVGFLKRLSCTVSKGYQQPVYTETEHHCDQLTKFTVDMSVGAGVFRLHCYIIGQHVHVELTNYLVITEVHTFYFNQTSNSIVCVPEYSEPNFELEIWWTPHGNVQKIGNGTELPLSNLQPDTKYDCHVSIEYVSCAPHQTFKGQSSGIYHHLPATTQATTTGAGPPTGDTAGTQLPATGETPATQSPGQTTVPPTTTTGTQSRVFLSSGFQCVIAMLAFIILQRILNTVPE